MKRNDMRQNSVESRVARVWRGAAWMEPGMRKLAMAYAKEAARRTHQGSLDSGISAETSDFHLRTGFVRSSIATPVASSADRRSSWSAVGVRSNSSANPVHHSALPDKTSSLQRPEAQLSISPETYLGLASLPNHSQAQQLRDSDTWRAASRQGCEAMANFQSNWNRCPSPLNMPAAKPVGAIGTTKPRTTPNQMNRREHSNNGKVDVVPDKAKKKGCSASAPVSSLSARCHTLHKEGHQQASAVTDCGNDFDEAIRKQSIEQKHVVASAGLLGIKDPNDPRLRVAGG